MHGLLARWYRLDADDIQLTCQIVGEPVQRHLSRNARWSLHQEVRGDATMMVGRANQHRAPGRLRLIIQGMRERRVKLYSGG
jgi:hypothetical protein